MKNNARFTSIELEAALSKANFINFNKEINVCGVSTDSRTIEKNNIFIALKGDFFDGHNSLESAFENGAIAAIVDEKWLANNKKTYKFPLISVKNTLKALGELAFFHRIRFNFPIIAIAGSNGKTSTKELISSVLSQRYKVLKTYKNFNNQIGVPLMMLQFDDTYQIAIIEIGTNCPGEIAILSEMLQPNLGLITNIGKEHLEQLIDIEQIEIEETFLFGQLMKNGGTCFINCDDERLARYKNIIQNTITYGTNENTDCDFNVKIAINDTLKPSTTFQINDEKFTANLNAIGYAIALNSTAAIAMGAAFGLSGKEIKKGLESYKEDVETLSYARMILQTYNNFTFLNDCYNANPSSMIMSIKTLSLYKNVNKKIAILGDMFELGEASEQEHYDILSYACKNLDEVIVTGSNMQQAANKINKNNIKHFNSTQDIANYLKTLENKEQSIFLLKGSRGMKMETVFNHL